MECSICRGDCSSEHERVPRYLRPELQKLDDIARKERIEAAVAGTKKKKNAAT